MSTNSPIRINKYLCESGMCSRKAADTHVANGLVLINGKQAMLGDKVLPSDIVMLEGVAIEPLPAKQIICIALNKPTGVVCTAAKSDKRNIVDYIDHSARIYPVGRLDKESQGLILLTNKSELVNKISGAGRGHEKEYVVTVNKLITDEFISEISGGVPMLGVVTRHCSVIKESEFVFKITLTQGLNRQIRRMCKHYGYSVKKLERIRIMHINLQGLEPGQWRNLTEDELSVFLQLPDHSDSGIA